MNACDDLGHVGELAVHAVVHLRPGVEF
jgi:hypothetical protein